jgi:hypothetical protein
VDFNDLGRGDGVAAAGELEAFEFVEGAVVGAFPADTVAGDGLEERGFALDVDFEGVAQDQVVAILVAIANRFAGIDKWELERLGLNGLEAAKLPDGKDEAGGEFELDRADGGDVVGEVALEGVELRLGLLVFEDGGGGVEAVFEGVRADGELTGGRDGAGGELGVAAVGRELGAEWHR